MTLREVDEILARISTDELLTILQDHRASVEASRPIGFNIETWFVEEIDNINKLIEIRIQFLRSKL